MDATNSLVNRIVQAQLPLLADHARTLHELAARLAPAREEMVAQWRQILDKDESLSQVLASGELADSGTHVLVDALNTENGLEPYLQGVAAWQAELSRQGANYADGTRLNMSFRRALLPAIIEAYPAGAELELVMGALDAHERAVSNLFAAVVIQATQQQLTQGAHLRSVGRLTGGVAHGMNNTIAVLVGRMQILEEQSEDEALRQELRAIQRIARGGADSLQQLQRFASDSEDGAPTRLDVNQMINQVVQLTRFRWRDDAEASGIAIEVVKDLQPLPPVIGQSDSLRDALVELVLNGVEAMPLGGLVTIRTDAVEDMVQIAISDQGEGMDRATRTRAVEPFFTTKGSGHVGLGLTAVAENVHKMGGRFQLTSNPGEGTTATIALPIASEIKQAPDLRPGRLARWANILVVDDEPLVRDVAARTFQLRGFRTAAADSGTDAVRVFTEQGPFEVVIVDLGMPGMNGFDTARAIKDINPRTIIILMTGWAAELDAKKLRDAGIDRAIAKPFEMDQVISLISEALAFQENIQ